MYLQQQNKRQLEDRIGHSFHQESLLLEALTHSTYAYEHRSEGLSSNERLEFLGDAVLDLAISDALFRQPAQHAEGYMTKTRALVVCENSLMLLARKLSLGELLLMGKGEDATGGRDKPSNLANAVEAIFGAIYLDEGYQKAKSVILKLLDQAISDALEGSIVYDYKSRLLELIQGKPDGKTIRFAIINEEGPVHERNFTAGVLINETLIASGCGSSKKEAEQQAAKSALEKLKS